MGYRWCGGLKLRCSPWGEGVIVGIVSHWNFEGNAIKWDSIYIPHPSAMQNSGSDVIWHLLTKQEVLLTDERGVTWSIHSKIFGGFEFELESSNCKEYIWETAVVRCPLPSSYTLWKPGQTSARQHHRSILAIHPSNTPGFQNCIWNSSLQLHTAL